MDADNGEPALRESRGNRPWTRRECSRGIPRPFPLRPAYPPTPSEFDGLADAPRPAPDIPPSDGDEMLTISVPMSIRRIPD